MGGEASPRAGEGLQKLRTSGLTKYKELIPVTVRLREDQIATLERITKIIRTLVDLFSRISFDKRNIEREEGLTKRLINFPDPNLINNSAIL